MTMHTETRRNQFRKLGFAGMIGLALALAIPLRAGTLVQIRTVFGDLQVELYDRDKPVTVRNFINYIQSGRYQNNISHRLVPGFVVQAGGFTLTTNGTSAITTFAAITNEFGVGKFYSNVYGTLAMAKTSDPNSATSQFFINLADNSASLDSTNNSGGFTVFGHVIAGTNVLNVINNFQNYTGTQTSNLVANVSGTLGGNFTTCPLLAPSLVTTNFLYLNITLMQVAIQPVTGGRQIAWNSASGLTNIVEFSTNLPPVWTPLLTTNGNGARMTIVDPAAGNRRFYRVRVAN